jgi:hypothetical protein
MPKPKDKETSQDSDSDTVPESDSDHENIAPPIAKQFTPKPKIQSTLTSYNFSREKATRQQSPKACNKDIETTRANQQEWFSPQPEQHRQREISTGG